MKTKLLISFLLISLSGFSQRNELEKNLLKGHWNFVHYSTSEYHDIQVNDTVAFIKISSSLKNRKFHPSKFKSNGTTKSLFGKFGSCGTRTTFESIFTLHWRKDKRWTTEMIDNKCYMIYGGYQLQLLENNQNKIIFIIREIKAPSL